MIVCPADRTARSYTSGVPSAAWSRCSASLSWLSVRLRARRIQAASSAASRNPVRTPTFTGLACSMATPKANLAMSKC